MDENQIAKLLQIKRRIEQVIFEKEAQIQSIQSEITELNGIIDQIRGLVTVNSFTTADNWTKSEESLLAKTQPSPAKSILSNQEENLPENVDFARKVFDSDGEYFAHIHYRDNTVEIIFMNPELADLTYQDYITKLVAGELIQLKEWEPELKQEVKRVTVNEQDLVRSIKLKNIFHFETIEEIGLILKKIFPEIVLSF